ncbi:MAG: sigma-E factor negative regulatory protein [Gammaproteobacteria bacterium]|nr:sigma-E factor negative regulatory protein [Gammaproteobacteria bacterium]
MKQKISELLDEELPESDCRHVLQGMAEDRELRGTWERYHLIRAAMRGELSVIVHPGIADRIGTILATENIVPMQRRPYRIATPRLAKFAAGLAIAASVATVAIVSLQPKTGTQARVQAGRAADRRIAAASLASATPPAAQAPAERAAYQDALNAFLVEHGEVTPPAGMGSMMSFVRVVGYRNDNSHR